MKFRPRFRLRTLFLVTTLAACTTAVLVWRQSTLKWIEQRHRFVPGMERPIDPNRHMSWYVTSKQNECWAGAFDEKQSELPWSLRMWGETYRAQQFLIGHDKAPEEVQIATDQIKRLFPEAEILDFNSKDEALNWRKAKLTRAN